jgi:hypothetical protein
MQDPQAKRRGDQMRSLGEGAAGYFAHPDVQDSMCLDITEDRLVGKVTNFKL